MPLRQPSDGPFYLLELQDGVEKQRIPVTLDIGTLEVRIRVPGGGVSVTPGTFDTLDVALIRENGERLFTWAVHVPVGKGDTIHLPSVELG